MVINVNITSYVRPSSDHWNYLSCIIKCTCVMASVELSFASQPRDYATLIGKTTYRSLPLRSNSDNRLQLVDLLSWDSLNYKSTLLYTINSFRIIQLTLNRRLYFTLLALDWSMCFCNKIYVHSYISLNKSFDISTHLWIRKLCTYI